MEILEFLIFLSVNIILLIITLVRKGALFSIIAIILTIFFIPYTLSSGLVLDRFYIYNSTSIVQTQTVKADPTFIVVIFFVLGIAHGIAILRSVSKE
jgi:hypothetical protein